MPLEVVCSAVGEGGGEAGRATACSGVGRQQCVSYVPAIYKTKTESGGRGWQQLHATQQVGTHREAQDVASPLSGVAGHGQEQGTPCLLHCLCQGGAGYGGDLRNDI
jgi:hypothetical protein